MEKMVLNAVVKILWVSMLSLLLVSLMAVKVGWAQQIVWTRQFGSPVDDLAAKVSVFSTGVYAVGDTDGVLPGQTSKGGDDAFVCKYDIDGNLKWLRQFGTSDGDYPEGVSVDGLGVYVVGWTLGAFPGQTNKGLIDAFVCKYDVNGNLKWLRQFGTSGFDSAWGVCVSGSAVYVAGDTNGAFPGQTNKGSIDAFVCKYDATYGVLLWTRQFGTSDLDSPCDVSADYFGVYVTGSTLGVFPGQTNKGSSDAFVCRYDVNGNLKWLRQFGTSDEDDAVGASVYGLAVYVTGSTLGAFPGQTNLGSWDYFVCKYDMYGNLKWLREFGTSDLDIASEVSVSPLGVYTSGWTDGAFPGQTNKGLIDAFVCKYDVNGILLWLRQFGTTGYDGGYGVAVYSSGIYVVGFTEGAFPGQTNAGGQDAFVCKYAPP